MGWLTKYDIYLQGGILMAIVAAMLLLVLGFLYIFNIEMKNEKMKYLFAFSSGFLLITAIVGQFMGARSKLGKHWAHMNPGHAGANAWQTIVSITIVVFGIALGSLFAYILKKRMSHSHGSGVQSHGCCGVGDHPKSLNTDAEIRENAKGQKGKTPIVYMLLTHKAPAGLLLGILVVNFNAGAHDYSLGALIAFILHMVPEVIITYHSRLQAGYSKNRSLVFAIFTQMLFLPFVFMGIALSNYISNGSTYAFWIMPMMLSMAAIFMVWAAIFELAPTFLHVEDNKSTYKLIFMFTIGLTTSLAVQLMHS